MIVAALSDPHMGGGGPADDCNYRGLLTLVRHMLTFRPTKIVLAGDIFERWQFTLNAIMAHNADFLYSLNQEFKLAEVKPDIEVVDGNHDPDAIETATSLQLALPSVRVNPNDEYFDFEDWRFLHGYQFSDKWNGKGILRPVAHGLTYFAGMLEKAFPGINENYLNPASWVSPAKKLDKSVAGVIKDEVFKYSRRTGMKICYGHIHEADISRDRRVINTGCCVGKKADGVVIFSDGNINALHVEV